MKRFALVVALATGCQPIPSPQPPIADADSSTPIPPDVMSDAAPAAHDVALEIPSGSQCEQSCAVLFWLGCREGSPTAKGERCTDTCQHAVDFPGLSLPTAAVIKCRDIACVRKAGIACK